MKTEVIFAADDLSGAAELAAGIAHSLGAKFQAGMIKVVLLHPTEPSPEAPENSIVVFDLDSRNASNSEVRDLVQSLGAKRSSAASQIFIKLDSILRGQVRGHLLRLSELGPVIFCPALPSLNRTVMQGVVQIDGRSLSDTDLWKTEKTNAPTSIQALFHAGETALISELNFANRESLTRAIRENPTGAKIFIADCRSSDDLALLATTVSQMPELMLAGSAEFGALFGSRLIDAQLDSQPLASLGTEVVKSVAIVVGSRSSMALRQVDFLQSLGASVFDLRNFSGGSEDLVDLFEEADVGVDCFLVSARSLGSQKWTTATKQIFIEKLHGRSLVLTGGATARRILSLLGVQSLMPLSDLGQGQVIALTDTALMVAIKPGSFGEFDTLHKLANHIRGPLRPKE